MNECDMWIDGGGLSFIRQAKEIGENGRHRNAAGQSTMRLPSDDSSLEDDASVSDNLPAHTSDEEQVGLVTAVDRTKRLPRRTTSSFTLALQTQAITVAPDPWEAIRTKQRRIRRRKCCFMLLVTTIVVAVAAFLVIEMAGESEEATLETTTHHQSHIHDDASTDMYDEQQRKDDDDLAIDSFDDDDGIASDSVNDTVYSNVVVDKPNDEEESLSVKSSLLESESVESESEDEFSSAFNVKALDQKELSNKSPLLESESEESDSDTDVPSHQIICPIGPPPPSDNDKPGNFDEYIEADKTKLTATGALAESAEGYRNEGYDGFSISYEQAKANIYDYITEYFVPPLRGGGSIYESACGTAANLLMTLEIISENGISDVTVYGSEYVADSVTVARQMLEAHMPKSFHMGSICQADSTNLEHVPSNLIDVVFTGYIDPIVDPLGLLDPEEDVSDAIGKSVKRCKSADEEDHAIAEKEQTAQEEWFARWVTEMVRITKPGGSLIIEDVAKPLCLIRQDWGGVSQAWWTAAVAKYGWDIDVDSITFEPGPRNPYRYKGRRYNVAMRKLGSI